MMVLERKYKKCLGMGYSKLIMGSCGLTAVINCVNYVKDALANASGLVIYLSPCSFNQRMMTAPGPH